MWQPIQFSRGGPGISHLFFIDDVQIFARANTGQICLIIEVLSSFCNASGLRVNFDKSRVMCSSNVRRGQKSELSQLVMGIPLLGARYVGLNGYISILLITDRI